MNKLAFDNMVKARAQMIVSQPFYATLALHLELVEDATCQTAWTDGRKLGYNPAWTETLRPSVRSGLWAHEVMHCANLHHTRRNGRDAEGWNEACDFVINGDLIKAGFKLWDGALIDARFDGLGAEEIFNVRRKEKAAQNGQQGQQGAQQQPGGSKGQAAGQGQQQGKAAAGNGQPSPGMAGEIRDAAPAHAKAEKEAIESDWKTNVRQALNVARARGAGKLPGDLQNVDVSSAAAVVDWKQETRRFIDQAAPSAYSFSSPDQRFLWQDLILPGLVSENLCHLILVIDDSSSIDMPAFQATTAEARAAFEDGIADKVTVIFCNTAVHNVMTFERGDVLEITARGSGGTSFAPAFAWIADNVPDASCIIYLTDLDVTKREDFGFEPAAPVLWAAYGSSKEIAARSSRVPFGEIIHIAA